MEEEEEAAVAFLFLLQIKEGKKCEATILQLLSATTSSALSTTSKKAYVVKYNYLEISKKECNLGTYTYLFLVRGNILLLVV